MRVRPLLLFLTVFLLAGKGSDDPFPKDYFRSPLDIPLNLSGNFAEMRSNHFHAGLDFRTNGTEGYPVYAAADGWVHRIVVSPVGYGLALYVAHPNGYSTVYAHLSRFNEALAAYVKDLQYENRSYRVDVAVPRGRFAFKQGEVIAYSGNSSGSGGPHLHFEIRDAASRPVNPLLFGFDVTDTTPPRIFALKLYPQDDGHVVVTQGGRTTIGTAYSPATIEVAANGRSYQLPAGTRIEAWGTLAFGLRTHDYHEGSRSRLGAYRIGLTADDAPLYQSEMQSFSYGVTRYLNAHVDYGEHRRSRRWFQRSHVLPGNKLAFYETTNRGYLAIEPGQTHAMAYTIEDAYGNTSRFAFAVDGLAAPLDDVPADAPAYAQHVQRTRATTFQGDGLTASFAGGTFYHDVYLEYDTAPSPRGTFSKAHVLHTPTEPAHKRYSLSIRPDDLPARLRPFALIAQVDDDGDLSAVGGSYSGGVVSARPRSFGTFAVAADTVAPVITPLNIRDGANLRSASSLRLTVEDDLSGLSAYDGRIDGQWVLFEYDAKRDRLTYRFDDRVGPGEHTLEFTATDRKGNTRVYRARFTR